MLQPFDASKSLTTIEQESTIIADGAAARRAPRGERLVGYAPHGHRKTITFVGGLRQRGMKCL